MARTQLIGPDFNFGGALTFLDQSVGGFMRAQQRQREVSPSVASELHSQQGYRLQRVALGGLSQDIINIRLFLRQGDAVLPRDLIKDRRFAHVSAEISAFCGVSCG